MAANARVNIKAWGFESSYISAFVAKLLIKLNFKKRYRQLQEIN